MNHKIYYHVYDETHEPCLIRQSSFEKTEGYPYKKCPVFNHIINRTFIATSPVDFYLKIDRTNEDLKFSCDNYDVISDGTFDENHMWAPKPVVQLLFPTFFFWTHSNNIWFEFFDHPMTSLNNNLITVSGWFNLSNWPRGTSFAFTPVDETKPVIIKKGDPLFRMKFIPPNLNDGIIMTREKNLDKVQTMIDLQDFNRIKGDHKKLFNQSEPKKCPFRFLFRK